MSETRRAAGAVLISACAFGSLAVGVTLANRAGVALQGLMAWRYLLATPLLMLVAGGPARLRIPGRDIRRLLILGGLGQVAVTSLSFSALRWIDAGTVGERHPDGERAEGAGGDEHRHGGASRVGSSGIAVGCGPCVGVRIAVPVGAGRRAHSNVPRRRSSETVK